MNRSDFSFELPEALIAQRPAPDRGGSRLMQIPVGGEPVIGPFADIVDAFTGEELLIINDSKVVPARIYGEKPTGGKVEMLVIRAVGPQTVGPHAGGLVIEAMLRGKNLKPGITLKFPEGVSAHFTARQADGTAEVVLTGIDALWSWLDRQGQIPLPPYIERDPDADDVERYQTVYARDPGSVAAPTAGLHFTDEILDAIKAKGVKVYPVTLHVGLGTFMPMRVDDVSAHHMHGEWYSIPEATAAALEEVRQQGRPIVCVGTTAVRAVESFAQQKIIGAPVETEIFIYPGFDFTYVDGLITNFHLPESTLLMLVSALAGRERVLHAYERAVESQMKFYSYGDATLMRREEGRWT
ncbi:MAG: tRNA preQ1(34) S-adenosylmethionine ribosyltransferase-isomerase QueA [Bradymonadia bacterium]